MTTPESEEGGVLREWAPMSRFLQQVPQKMWHSFFFEDVKFTCIAADTDCIAIGTSSGVVFWYERMSHSVHQLKAEKSNHYVSCVSITSSVEYMVASGDKSGVVTIFRIPKDIPKLLPNQKTERIERYTVDELHSSEITALVWSMNGQKLFSGDSKGRVILTEIDYFMSITRAYEILNEKYKIVQLSYNQREQILIVATELRSVICHKRSPSWKVVQIGQRERHSLLELGANFCFEENNQLNVYSCRGGLRLWKSDLEGNVKHTIIFKELVNSSVNPVKLLRPMKRRKEAKYKPYEFGKLFYWTDGLYVAHYENNLIVLDPESITVAATILDAEQNFTSVATTKMEIFIIFGGRNLIRLAYAPDKFNSSIGGYGNLASAELVSGLPNFYIKPVVGTPINTPENSFCRVKLSATTANTELPVSEVTYGTESVTLLNPVLTMRDGIPELRTDTSRYHLFSAIGQQDFDEIVYIKKNKLKHKTAKNDKRKSFPPVSTKTLKNVNYDFDEPLNSSTFPGDLLIDLKDRDDIDKVFRENESLLDIILPSLSEVSLDKHPSLDLHIDNISKFSESPGNILNLENTTKQEESEGIVYEDLSKSFLNEFIDESVNSHNIETSTPNISFENNNPITEDQLVDIPLNSNSSFTKENGDSPLLDDSITDNEQSSDIVFVGDEEQPAVIKLTSEHYNHQELAYSQNSVSTKSFELFSYPVTFRDLSGGWSEMSCPEKVIWMCPFNNGLVVCSPRLRVFIYKDKEWCKLPYKAQTVIITNDEKLTVKVHCSIAHFTDNFSSLNENWKLLSHGVDWVTITEDKTIWFVTQGDIYFLKYNNNIVDQLFCNQKVQKVYSWKKDLYAITSDNKIITFDGQNWYNLKTPKLGVKHIVIGPNRLIWATDLANKLFVSDFLELTKKPKLSWWKVDICGKEPFDATSLNRSEEGIFVSNGESASVLFNKSSVLGHRWIKSEVDMKCLQMTAEGVFEDKGCVWLLSTPSQLLSVTPCLSDYENIDVPCNIICIAASPQVLWLLSDEGEIYVRQQITNCNPSGVNWAKLNLEQFDHVTQIVHISCGCDVVWACDIRGVVFMLVASPHEIHSYSFSPAWVRVEGRPIHNNTFTKVFVGPQSHMVWALDNAGNVYVREAIFPDFLVGTDWVHVPGIVASQLSISTETVRALSKEGIYTRVGITQNNYIGDAWQLKSIQIEHLSVTVNECIYAVSSGTNTLMTHIEKIFPISEDVFVEKDWNIL
ncbi:tectonin beta-propeller repeat-containing protein 2 [Cimex lectularius]|uniref:Uncharacterized protein n=1 Tax=Cimex lectularius TaxID=79782 RepID=A0A8I6RN42_CIMLE|nr:tectonin beta-propeller repeat-containing protein 2 [Cimex lectularius]